MTDLLKEFGLDAAEVHWKDFAACKNLDPKYFDRYYQDKPKLRPVVDEICLSCPVFKECATEAVLHKESYVWAATYFDNGTMVPEMNDHKTDEVKARMAERLSE
jgi:hypothetical protein